jgi:hypothetical protein
MESTGPGTPKKNPAAVALGKLRAASMTAQERQNLGHARAAALSPARRKAIAKKAAAARWGKKG